MLIIDKRRQFLGVVDVNSIQTHLKQNKTLQEIMVGWPTVGETDSVKTAVQLMVEQNVRFVPVVNDSGRLKGIITRARVVNFVLDYM